MRAGKGKERVNVTVESQTRVYLGFFKKFCDIFWKTFKFWLKIGVYAEMPDGK